MMFRIEWVCILTNYRSNGSWFKSTDKKMLEDSIKFMNDKYNGEVRHWLVNNNSDN